tara:strand:+ start:18317 stop:19273 length:957 start_codon:yes stop_codon:yes gene_type:complete
MINEVRQTVLAIANKNNYGYISRLDFNHFARQAQLEIFKEYMYDYNTQINKQNKRVSVNQSVAKAVASNDDYADLAERKRQVIEIFSTIAPLGNTGHVYDKPTNLYLLNKLFYYNTQKASGTSTSGSGSGVLEDTGATFTNTVSVGDLVVNTTDNTLAFVSQVAATTLTLTEDIFANSEAYKVFNPTKYAEIELQDPSRAWNLAASNLTAPTTTFPSCLMQADNIIMYPNTINNSGSVVSQYVRNPLDPKWTGVTVGAAQGQEIFDATASDFQDFELPESEIPYLIAKIATLAGMSIRENQLYKDTAVLASMNANEDR